MPTAVKDSASLDSAIIKGVETVVVQIPTSIAFPGLSLKVKMPTFSTPLVVGDSSRHEKTQR